MEKEALEFLKSEFSSEAWFYMNGAMMPLTLIPNTMKIESLEQYLSSPTRFRAAYKTQIIDEFIAYCNEHKTTDSRIYIDQNNMESVAIFDHGRSLIPEWGDHTANLSLISTPEYRALQIKEDEQFGQQELTDWLQDWYKNINFYDSNSEVIPFQVGINNILNLKFNKNRQLSSQEGNFNRELSAMERIEMESMDGTAPPAYFTFTAKPYEGFEEREFICPIRGIKQEDKPFKFKYRIRSLDATKQLIVEEFKNKIKEQVIGLNVHIGTIKLGI